MAPASTAGCSVCSMAAKVRSIETGTASTSPQSATRSRSNGWTLRVEFQGRIREDWSRTWRGAQARRHLAPDERAGGRRAGQWAQGKRPHDRLPVAILTEVDVDLPPAGTDGSGDGRDLRLCFHPEHGEQAREGAHLVVGVARPERDQDVQARRPGGLRIAG